MAEIENKDVESKVVTVESLKALHDYNEKVYMSNDTPVMLNENPVGSGSLSLNRMADTTVGLNSVAIGNETTASGNNSYAEGDFTIASGDASHAEGQETTASGYRSHAEGVATVASGSNSHAEGYSTHATGNNSHAEGYGTNASSNYQHVQGKYNIEDKDNKYAHIVGNGTSDSNRSNAHTLDWDGNAWFAGYIILSDKQYGDGDPPAAGIPGRIYFKKVT